MAAYMNDFTILIVSSFVIGLMLGFPIAFTVNWISRRHLEVESKLLTQEICAGKGGNFAMRLARGVLATRGWRHKLDSVGGTRGISSA
jgi:hypothetical protein